MNPIIKYYPNGKKESELYYNSFGQLHNENGPARILYYHINGNKFSEQYCINGKLCNIKGYAHIEYDEIGNILREAYWLNDKLITYYPTGNKESEAYVNDLLEFHNEVKPAIISYHENGNKKYEGYHINGKRHNINGPAYIYYNINGEIESNDSKEYYLNGKLINVNSDEEFQKYIKILSIS